MDTQGQVGFFDEAPGRHSSMRLMSMLALLMAFVYGLIAIYTDSENGLLLSLTAFAGAFGPKSVQKLIEQKYKDKGV